MEFIFFQLLMIRSISFHGNRRTHLPGGVRPLGEAIFHLTGSAPQDTN